MKKAILFFSLLVTGAVAEDFYKPASVHCPGRDSSCLTNMIAGIGTNYTTVMLDGGPWVVSNTVIVPSNIELLFARNVSFTNVGTNAVHVNTDRTRQDWLTNLNVEGDANISNLFTAYRATITTTITVFKIIGDGSGLTNITISGTIGYLIDGTTNITQNTITGPSMATGAVSTVYILDGGIGAVDMGTNSVVGYSNILNGSILSPQMGTNSVTTEKITDGTIITVDLATNSVTTEKITDGTILSNDIAAATLDISKLNTNYLKFPRMVGYSSASGSAAGLAAGSARVMMISTTQVPRSALFSLYCYLATSNSADANFYNELSVSAEVSSNSTVWLPADKTTASQGAVNGNGFIRPGQLQWYVPAGMYYQVYCAAGTVLSNHQGWTNAYQVSQTISD